MSQDNLKTKKFQKCLEDFTCKNCQTLVKGNGLTNHCPICLYSLHVDVNPGDRQANCGALMAPIDYIVKNGQNIIIHQCLKCKFTRNNKVASDDDFASFFKTCTDNKIYR